VSDDIGNGPRYRAIVLSQAAGFVHHIKPRTVPFPEGLEARIELWDSTFTTLLDTWDATSISTGLVAWGIVPATANAIPENSRYRMYLTYPTAPALPYLWAHGQVVRQQ
jgi:hypothetical protein